MRQLSLKTLLPFLTSNVGKVGFSALSATRSKLSNRLDIRNTLRVSLSPSTPHWERLVAGKQSLSSHWLRSTGTMLHCLYSVCSGKEMWNWKAGHWFYTLTWRKMQALFMSACVCLFVGFKYRLTFTVYHFLLFILLQLLAFMLCLSNSVTLFFLNSCLARTHTATVSRSCFLTLHPLSFTFSPMNMNRILHTSHFKTC